MNKKIIELSMEAEKQKNTYSLDEFNKKLKKTKLKSKRNNLNTTETKTPKNEKGELNALRQKMDKELSFLNEQRKDLNTKISQFLKQKVQLEREKKKFKRKKLLFKRQKKQFKRELKWFRKQKEEFETRKGQFEAKRTQFLKEKRQFETKRIKKKKSQNNTGKIEKKKKPKEDYTLSLGDYILIPYNEMEKKFKTISLYGLGSSYVLILVEPKTKVLCMSHILFPKAKVNQNSSKIEKRHQYASLCVPYLIKKMLVKGASEKMIYAYLIGGAQIFNKKYESIKKTYTILTKELDSYNIKILGSDIGGETRRTIRYDLNKEQLLLSHVGEDKFEIL